MHCATFSPRTRLTSTVVLTFLFACSSFTRGADQVAGYESYSSPQFAQPSTNSPFYPSSDDSTVLAFNQPPQYPQQQPPLYLQPGFQDSGDPVPQYLDRPYTPWGGDTPSYSRNGPYTTWNKSHGTACGQQTGYGSGSDIIPLSPGFPNYDRWSQQITSPSCWQVLPDGLIFPSYLAGPKEPRICGVWNHDKNLGWIWDATAGGRMPLLRYGTKQSVLPEGFQIDVEGAGMVRIDYENDLDLLAADFRAGLPITFGNKRTQYKLAYYHLSSHLGDEYMLRSDARKRINYVRDAIVFAVAYRIQRDIRIYGEAAWAFFTGETTEPWEFQFGAEYSPIYPANRQYGSPFVAIHAHLLQELDFGGNLNFQIGWQWRGPSNHLFRVGVQYFCGASDQYEFQDCYESKIGIGLWADF